MRIKPLTTIIDELLVKIAKKDQYSIFAELVPRELTHYYEHIKSPTSLGLMQEKNSRRHYRSLDDFKAEFDLMIANCCAYNAPASVYYKEALKLKKQCEPMILKAASLVDASTSIDSGGALSSLASLPNAMSAPASDDEAPAAGATARPSKRFKTTHVASASGSVTPQRGASPEVGGNDADGGDDDDADVDDDDDVDDVDGGDAAASPLPQQQPRVLGNRIVRAPQPDESPGAAEAVVMSHAFTTTCEQLVQWRANQDVRRAHAVSGADPQHPRGHTGPPAPIAAADVFSYLMATAFATASAASPDGSAMPAAATFPGCFARSVTSFLGRAPVPAHVTARVQHACQQHFEFDWAAHVSDESL